MTDTEDEISDTSECNFCASPEPSIEQDDKDFIKKRQTRILRRRSDSIKVYQTVAVKKRNKKRKKMIDQVFNGEAYEPVYCELARPNHALQVLNTLVGKPSQRPNLQLRYLSRRGTSRMVYDSYQRGTSHAVGFWPTAHLYSISEMLVNLVFNLIKILWRRCVLEACFGWGRKSSGLDVD